MPQEQQRVQIMGVEAHDQFILSLDDSHPAKKFFIAFCECRDNSVGRHHDWAGEEPIEQAWVSADGKQWLFSSFAYQYLSLKLELDGCVNNIPHLTPNEVSIVETIPIMRALMQECCNAARSDKNLEILILANEVLAMLALGEEYIKFRKCAIRFTVDAITRTNNEFIVPGRVDTGTVRLGSVFNACEGKPDVSKNMNLTVNKIVAYRHSLEELSQGVTGQLTLAGELSDQILEMPMPVIFLGTNEEKQGPSVSD